jgi:hypothetical protein
MLRAAVSPGAPEARRRMNAKSSITVETCRDIEAALCEPPFRGVSMGATLNDILFMDLFIGRGEWGLWPAWRSRLLLIKHYWMSQYANRHVPPVSRGRILVTLASDNYRVTELIYPVIEALGPEHCLLLAGGEAMRSATPSGMESIAWSDAAAFDVAAWRADYRRVRSEWHRRLRAACRKHRLPRGASDAMAFRLLCSSKSVAGCFRFLAAARPTAVVTEYDRNPMWSCLALAARQMGIPTFGLVHGVLNEGAVGAVPVVADTILCWGDMQRRQLIAGGETRAEIVVAGCPRLTRELPLSPAEARTKLGLRPDRPVVMLGTTRLSASESLAMAEMFCEAVAGMEGVSAVVRLHPCEELETYQPAIERHPNVRFFRNSDWTLDDSLAAADIVVVPNSGLGSDALVKRRLTIVLKLPNMRLSHGQDLIEQAGCLAVASSESLRSDLLCLLADTPQRRICQQAREAFVSDFVAYFGEDAAHRIAEVVCRKGARVSPPSNFSGAVPA